MIKLTNWHVCVPDEYIRIGYEAENLASRITIQLDQPFAGWQFKLDITRPDGQLDILDLIRDGDTVYMDITEDLGLIDGRYRCQLRGMHGDVRQMSNIFTLHADESIKAITALERVPPSELHQLEARLTAIKTDVEQMAGDTSADAQTASDAAGQASTQADQALQSAAQAASSASDAAASATASTTAQTAAVSASTAAQQALTDTQAVMSDAEQARDAAWAAAGQAHDAADQTAADRVQTGLDRQASEGAAAQTDTDRQAVAADKQVVQDAATEFTGQTIPAAVQAVGDLRDDALTDIITQRDTSVQAVSDTGAQQIAAIDALDVYTQTATDALLAAKADQPYATAEGESLTITDSAGGALGVLEIYGNSVQDGVPSPDAPAPIGSVTSPIKLSVMGQNLYRPHAPATVQGVTLTHRADGGVTLNGTALASSVYLYNAKLAVAGQYCLTAGNESIPTSIGNALVQLYIPSTGASLLIANNTPIGRAAVGNLPADTVISWRIRIEGGVTYNNFVLRPQLTLGSIKLPFAPYTGTDYTIPLLASDRVAYPDPLELRSLPNGVQDTVQLGADGRYKLIQHTQTATLDEKAPWQDYGSKIDTPHCAFYVKIPNCVGSESVPTSIINILNHGPNETFSKTGNASYYITKSTNSYIYINILRSYINALPSDSFDILKDKWFTYLKTNPIKMILQRVVPIEIDLDGATQAILHSISLPAGTANLWTTGSVKPTLKPMYRQDLGAYIRQTMDSIIDTVATNQIDMDARISALELTGGK